MSTPQAQRAAEEIRENIANCLNILEKPFSRHRLDRVAYINAGIVEQARQALAETKEP